jgi:hypothetical protein
MKTVVCPAPSKQAEKNSYYQENEVLSGTSWIHHFAHPFSEATTRALRKFARLKSLHLRYIAASSAPLRAERRFLATCGAS